MFIITQNLMIQTFYKMMANEVIYEQRCHCNVIYIKTDECINTLTDDSIYGNDILKHEHTEVDISI